MTHVSLTFAAVLSSLACGFEQTAQPAPSPDAARFEAEVYPILLRDCGFPACHGATARFYRIHGPGRTRLSTDTKPQDPATSAEIALSYARTRSMLRGVSGVSDSPFLRKPLAVAAGGAGHEGIDGWGRDVYVSTDDPSYQALRDWALSEPSGPTEAERAGVGP